MNTPSLLERLLRRDRQVVLASLALAAALAWAYTLAGAGMDMSALGMTRPPWPLPGSEAMDGMSAAAGMPMATGEWTTGHAALMLAMWWVMMIAMMLPGAAPTILLAAALNRRADSDRAPYGAAGMFASGYLLVWLLFSGVAVAVQWLLVEQALLSGMLRSDSAVLTAALLIATGVWQLSPVKHACLRHCRSPVDYLTRHRRRGNRGALLMGMGHGAYCLGCCWFLMALLFAGGVMDLYWIAGLALFVLAEKLLPGGVWFARAAGVGLIGAGAMVVL